MSTIRDILEAAEKMRRMQEEALRIARSPAYEATQRAYEDMESLRHSTAAEAARQFSTVEAAARGFDQMRRIFEEAQHLTDRHELVLQAAQRQASFLEGLRQAVRDTPVLQAAAEYGSMIAAFREAARSPAAVAMIEEARRSESFLERVLANAIVIDADVDNDVDEPLATVLPVVEERVASLPRGTISREGMIQLWLAILFFVIQTIQSELSDRELRGHTDRALADATKALMAHIDERLAPLAEQPEEIRVVVERLNIRVAPDKAARSVALLEPGIRLNVVTRADGWIEVEYFDTGDAEVKRGWVAEIHTKHVVPI